jgi:dolichol-phosphate mannosyltransferase
MIIHRITLLIRLLQSEFAGKLFLEKNQKNRVWEAYVHGFKWALAHKYDFIFEMDADFSHNPNDLENYTMPVT